MVWYVNFAILGVHETSESSLNLSWTIYFDTVYATQDREDDARVGVKSTARLFGTWLWEITACFAMCTVALLAYAGYLSGHGAAYYVLACGGAMTHFAWQLNSWVLDSDKSSGKIFKASTHPVSNWRLNTD